jgi:uncharacterized delta-60 repeat protein
MDFLETPQVLHVQPDGKVLVFGSYYDSLRKVTDSLLRFFPDGIRDEGFSMQPDFVRRVTHVHVLEDGKIVVAGLFRLEGEFNRHQIIRLLPDGTPDPGFDSSKTIRSVMKTVYCIAVQPDGKMLVGGDFTPFAEESGLNLVRLHTDGSRDRTFETGEGFDKPVNCLMLQPDGKILAGGDFESYDGYLGRGITRLLPDGRPDEAFHTGQGFSGSVNAMGILPSGQILAGGKFTSFNGCEARRIALLNGDGSICRDFDAGMGFDDSVNALALLPQNRVVVGGNFMSYRDMICNRIAFLDLNDEL